MKAAWFALLLSLLAVVLLIVAGPGSRFGWWDFRTGFDLMRWAVYIGFGAALVALLMLLLPRTRRSGPVLLGVALVLGLVAALIPLNNMRIARSVPAIHDISTDTEQPPAFVAILPLRADAPNSSAYGGVEVARAQHAAYPELHTWHSEADTAATFERALKTAREMGWQIVAADPASGRIEATDTTFWFGFKDDIVIRVEAEGEGSKLDIRSVSRVGKSDVGANAARTRTFLDKL